MKHTIKDWIILTRTWGHVLSFMPAVLAIAYAFYRSSTESITVNWWYGILAALAAPILQSGGNLISDYYDYKNNVDRKGTYGSSPMLVDKIFTTKEVFWFGIICMVVGNLIGLYLLFNTSFHLLWIGLIGVFGSYFYFFFKYKALGDLTIFVIYGQLISLGTYLVMTNMLSWEILLVAAAPGLLIVNVLHANNTRDIKNDKVANIKTMAMLMGVKGSIRYYTVLGLGAYLLVLVTVLIGIQHWLTLIVFLSFPLLLKAIKQMQSADIDKLENIKQMDEASAQLVMVFVMLQVIGTFAGGLV
ncbi:MAG: prenyltransferase [Ignavibacteria bacterium]|jgi:1,4-dihydroxy-2-naphthoate octaprenyltransferase|nr:prenyltransferase [Ignavibacteria bacterium]